MNKKKELLLALRILGRRLKEKRYNKDKIIEFCRQVRKDVYNAEMPDAKRFSEKSKTKITQI